MSRVAWPMVKKSGTRSAEMGWSTDFLQDSFTSGLVEGDHQGAPLRESCVVIVRVHPGGRPLPSPVPQTLAARAFQGNDDPARIAFADALGADIFAIGERDGTPVIAYLLCYAQG